ncbi:hypothetical protein BGZ76_001987 [Entomortierella beljakovae]|nr:hypothetical protein BGZ76_001987 [Entomortierella beljakovae]
MKIFSALAALATAAMVSAQSSCFICLQTSIQALPLCQKLSVIMGEFDPASDPDMPACLCSSLDGSWIDACTDANYCGQDIFSFKDSYAKNLQSAGLSCGPTPSYVPTAPTSVPARK